MTTPQARPEPTGESQSTLLFSCRTGAVDWLGAMPISGGLAGIAEIRQNTGKFEHLAVIFDESGLPTGRDLALDLGGKSADLVAPIGVGNAVICSIERELEENRQRYWPVWRFLNLGPGKIRMGRSHSWVNRVSMWPPPVVARSGDSVLLFCHNAQTASGDSLGTPAPLWIAVSPDGEMSSWPGLKEELPPGANQFDFLDTGDGRLFAVFVCDWQKVYIAEVMAEGTFSRPSLLASLNSHWEIDRPRLFMSSHKPFVLWHQNNCMRKRTTRALELFVLPLSTDFMPEGRPRKLIPDREVVQWTAAKTEDGLIIAWKTGFSKTANLASIARFSSERETQLEVPIRPLLPDMIVSGKSHTLALQHQFIEEPYEWQLRSQILTSNRD